MKIRFTTSVAGANFSFDHDEEVDLRVDIAKAFINCGQAVLVREDDVEHAAVRQVEQAVNRAARRARRAFGL